MSNQVETATVDARPSTDSLDDVAVLADDRPASWFQRWFGSWSWFLGVVAVAVAVPALMVGLHMDRYPKLSPIDEGAHLDYVQRVSKFEIPRTGDLLTRENAVLTACRGAAFPVQLPECNQNADPRALPGGGYQYEAQQPPLYYMVTAPLRWGFMHGLGFDNYLDAARATGVLWLSAGLWLMWFAGRRLRIPKWPLLAAMLLAAAAPNVVYYSSIVSNDATAVACGAGLVLIVAWATQRRTRATPWLLALAAFVAVMLKQTNVIAVLGLAAFVVWMGFDAAPDARFSVQGALRRARSTAGPLLAGGITALFAWLVASNLLQYRDAATLPVFAGRAREFDFSFLASQGSAVLVLATGSAPTPVFRDPSTVWWIQLTQALFLVAAFGIVVVRRKEWHHALGFATMVGAVCCAIALSFSIYFSLKMDPGIVSRYGLSAVPILALCLAAAARTRLSSGVVTVVAAGLFLSTTAALVAA